MKIVLYSKSNYIVNELQKINELNNTVIRVNTFIELKEILKGASKLILLHHIDDFPDDIEHISTLLKAHTTQIQAIGLSNTPDTLQGCRLLQLGYKSYLHAFSNNAILKSAIESVGNGNIYVYPKLMQFLVSQIPTSMQENKNLDSLSSKELEVLQLVSKGFSNAKIANELDIAEVTVKKHIGSMFEKLNVKDRLSLALILK